MTEIKKERDNNILDDPPPLTIDVGPEYVGAEYESDDSPLPSPPKLERQFGFYNLHPSIKTKKENKLCVCCGSRNGVVCKRGCGISDYCKKCQHTRHRVCDKAPPVLIYEPRISQADLNVPRLEFELEVERQHVAELNSKLLGMQELYEKQKHDNFIKLASAEQQYEEALEELKRDYQDQIENMKKNFKEQSVNMKSQIEAFRDEYNKVKAEDEKAMAVAAQIQKVKSLKKKIKEKHDDDKFRRLSQGQSSYSITSQLDTAPKKRGRPKKKPDPEPEQESED